MAHPIHKHMHTHITKRNVGAAERDDKAHIDYLKRDVLWDNKHGHSDIDMTADETHISKLAGDIKHDKKKEGLSRNSSSPLNIPDRRGYEGAGGTDLYGGAGVPGEISLTDEDLVRIGKPRPRATGPGSIDFTEKAGTTSMPDWNYEGDLGRSMSEGFRRGTEMSTEAAQEDLGEMPIVNIERGDAKGDWQSIVNAKRAAGIGYQTEYKTDANGNTISGLRFDDGTFLKD
jgi:hypothetical protein